jgi:mRNA-degrading endonuclease RelE of RelBE toxin-antitoxin system
MVDKIEKALNKLSEKERKELKMILKKISKGDFKRLNVKKLRGRSDVYRVRKGKMRVLFLKKGEVITVLAVERRSETTN